LNKTRQILGVRFHNGDMPGLLERTAAGGLVVVPSAPVLVGLAADPAQREALEGSDLAVTDSGFMVLLWGVFQGERLTRLSGLRYVRALLEWPEFRQPGATFWIMPTAEEGAANRAWLATQGIPVAEADCYVAPKYAARGALSDEALLKVIGERRPRFVMINLGGGVQERLGWFLKQELQKAGCDGQSARGRGQRDEALVRLALGARPLAAGSLPALICTGAAIAFLSGRQVNIPVWADRLFLGWLFRILSAPTKFFPRYWQAMRLAPLIWKYRERSVNS